MLVTILVVVLLVAASGALVIETMVKPHTEVTNLTVFALFLALVTAGIMVGRAALSAGGL